MVFLNKEMEENYDIVILPAHCSDCSSALTDPLPSINISKLFDKFAKSGFVVDKEHKYDPVMRNINKALLMECMPKPGSFYLAYIHLYGCFAAFYENLRECYGIVIYLQSLFDCTVYHVSGDLFTSVPTTSADIFISHMCTLLKSRYEHFTEVYGEITTLVMPDEPFYIFHYAHYRERMPDLYDRSKTTWWARLLKKNREINRAEEIYQTYLERQAFVIPDEFQDYPPVFNLISESIDQYPSRKEVVMLWHQCRKQGCYNGFIYPLDPELYKDVFERIYEATGWETVLSYPTHIAIFKTAFGHIGCSRLSNLSDTTLIELNLPACIHLYGNPFYRNDECIDSDKQPYFWYDFYEILLHARGALEAHEVYSFITPLSEGGELSIDNVTIMDFDEYIEQSLKRLQTTAIAHRSYITRAGGSIDHYIHGQIKRAYLDADIRIDGISVDSSHYVTFYPEGMLCDATISGDNVYQQMPLEPCSRIRFGKDGRVQQGVLLNGVPIQWSEWQTLRMFNGLYFIITQQREGIREQEFVHYDTIRNCLSTDNPLFIDEGYLYEAGHYVRTHITQSDLTAMIDDLYFVDYYGYDEDRKYPLSYTEWGKICLLGDVSDEAYGFCQYDKGVYEKYMRVTECRLSYELHLVTEAISRLCKKGNTPQHIQTLLHKRYGYSIPLFLIEYSCKKETH